MYCVGKIFVQYTFAPLAGKVPKFCPATPWEIKLLQAAGAGEPEGVGGADGVREPDALGVIVFD